MKCLEICHSQNICHGDVNPENILITSWNWVVLTDFSPFKPTTIPVDDPADFNYFYDSMGRRRCCLAPERFYHRSSVFTKAQSTTDGLSESSLLSGDQEWDNLRLQVTIASTTLSISLFVWFLPFSDNSLKNCSSNGLSSKHTFKPSMDVYSLGCTIAEIFLGEPLLDLPATLQYVGAPSHTTTLANGENAWASNLSRIVDQDIKTLVCHMTQRNPKHRRSVRWVSFLLIIMSFLFIIISKTIILPSC